MKTILVTGGAGFIGSNFIFHVLSKMPEVNIINMDDLTYAGSMDNLKGLPGRPNYTFVKADISHEKLVYEALLKYQPDTIVHFAAETHVDNSINTPERFMTTNIMGTYVLLEYTRLLSGTKPIRFHYISTDEVYGSLSPSEAPWTEDSPYAPNPPYAATKAACDHLVRSYGHTYGLHYTITHCTNNYGPRQHREKLIPMVINNALEGKQIPVYGNGKQIRDWIHVKDHCEAIRLVLTKGRIGETYNVGGDNQQTNLEIIYMICGMLDIATPLASGYTYTGLIEHVEDRLGHDRRYAIDTTKIREELGWEPEHKVLSIGLQETIKWYMRKNDNGN